MFYYHDINPGLDNYCPLTFLCFFFFGVMFFFHSFDRNALELLDRMLTLDPSEVSLIGYVFFPLCFLFNCHNLSLIMSILL